MAWAAAVAVPGVRAPGPRPGVVATAESAGRYSVDLELVGALVALVPLGDRVRQAVADAAESAGLRSALGEVNVTFVAVEEGTPW